MVTEEALEGLIKERDSEKANRDIWDEKEDRVRSDRYVEMLNIAIKALGQVNRIKEIIAIDNVVIQEDVLKYKMICEVLE